MNPIITTKKYSLNFIPAKESKLVIWFFYHYTRFMLWKRFKKVHIEQFYSPKENSKTVYYINHNYWWDGLLPLYLNNKLFKQNARALMEDKQMRQYPFFSRIGAFSINLEDSRDTIKSLRYAVDSLQEANSSLFIYPEGKLTPSSDSKPVFKEGLAWLYQKTELVDLVPVAFYIDHSKANKPDLFILIGKSVKADKALAKNELTSIFEAELHTLLKKLRKIKY